MTFGGADSLTAKPPAPAPAKQAIPVLPVTDADDEPFIDINQHGFDSPAVRHERLRVLTGGELPVEQFRTCKTVCSRKLAGFFNYSASPVAEHLTDLIFTDSGLMLAKLAALPKKGESANTAFLHLGLIGLIAYSIAESRRVTRGKTDAERVYFDLSDRWAEASPAKIFRRVPNSEFSPADEISRARIKKSGMLEFYYRGRWYSAKPETGVNRRMYRMPDEQEFQDWIAEAAANRAARTGGPANPGPAALAEWADRKAPDSDLPKWVIPALERTEEFHGDDPKRLFRWLPKTVHATLFHRLADVDTPAATAWRRRLSKRLRFRGFVLLAVGLVCLIASLLCFLPALLGGQDEAVGPAVLGVIFGLPGIVTLIWGAVVVARYRCGSG
jgi:hypothetical protein